MHFIYSLFCMFGFQGFSSLAASGLFEGSFPSQVSVFIYNETGSAFEVINEDQKLKVNPKESGLYTIPRIRGKLVVDQHIILKMGDSIFIDPIDPKNQVSGLGGEFLKIYGVPENVEFAFAIMPPNEGDAVENFTPAPIE